MSASLRVRDSLGERQLARAAFPLSIGGPGCTVSLAGAASEPLAWLGIHEEQLFLQPAGGAEILHNGVLVRQSAWLRTGDVLTAGSATLRLALEHGERVLAVDDGAGGNRTVPPELPAAAHAAAGTSDDDQQIARIRYQAAQQFAATPRPQRSRWPLVASIAGIALAALVWWLSSSSAVQLSMSPANTELQVEGGWFAPRFGSRLLLRPGSYRLRATHAGYETLERSLEVGDAAGQTLTINLEKLPGRIEVKLPAEGRISVATLENVTVPGVIELPAGTHAVQLAVPRHLPFSAELEVAGEGKLQVFEPTLVPDWAAVSVSTEPLGARLLVDGRDMGATPQRIELASGAHRIELRLAGFRPWTNDLLVKANESQTIGPVRLGVPDGSLLVQSSPSGARVLVGGVYRGQTPLRVAVRPDVPTALQIEAPGHEPALRSVAVAAGRSESLSAELQPILGEITVKANFTDAEVFADGQRLGGVNATYALSAVEHQIEVRKAGYQSYKVSIVPRPGLAQAVNAELLTAEQQRVARVPSTLKARGFIDMKLMPTGRYLMGSSRREPGRRANEIQRGVELRRPFYLGVREVTNGQFREFRATHKSGLFKTVSLNVENQPVAGVSWDDAVEFCNWLSLRDGLPPAYQKQGADWVAVTPMTTGYRLPTEAEWEWVARYRGGGATQRYPWGEELPVAPKSGNYADETARTALVDVLAGYDDGFLGSAPVGSYTPSALGLYDLGGNVSEWTNDLYSASFSGSEMAVDPLATGAGNQHVVRGASWRSMLTAELRNAARAPVAGARDDLGFRIARYVE